MVPACRQAGSRTFLYNRIMYVYVLKSLKHNWYYTGLSEDIDYRFEAHNNGWVKTTKFYRPFKLVHTEIVQARSQARKIEKYFKSGYGKEIIKKIDESISNDPL